MYQPLFAVGEAFNIFVKCLKLTQAERDEAPRRRTGVRNSIAVNRDFFYRQLCPARP